MTKARENFVTYSVFDKPRQITLGNKLLMMAYGHGDINAETCVNGQWLQHTLTDVRHTSDVVTNLFSVPSAANKGIVYWIDDKEYKIIRDDVMLVTGEIHHGLYKLNMRVIGLANE